MSILKQAKSMVRNGGGRGGRRTTTSGQSGMMGRLMGAAKGFRRGGSRTRARR